MSAGRIGLLHYQAYPDIRVAKFAKTLATAGFDVTVLAREAVDGTDARAKHPYAGRAANVALPGLTVRAITPPGVTGRGRAMYLPYHFNPLWRSGIRRLLDEGCELLVVRDLHLVLAATSLAHPRGVPVLFDMAENYPAVLATWRRYEGVRRAVVNGVLRNVHLARLVEKGAARTADAVSVVVPEHVARVSRLRGTEENIVVVENTPDLAEFPPVPARDEAPASAGRPLSVVYTGEIHRYRGIDTIIAAARMLAEDHDDSVRFTLVGTGKLAEELERETAAARVQHLVQFTGWQPDLFPFMLAADVGIVPPHASAHYDVTMPNKLYDFMALGKAVLVSDTPPMRRVVQSTGSGLVFRAGDAADLVRQLRALAQPDVRARHGSAGRRAVLDRYNWDVDGAVLVDTVASLLQRKRVPA